MTKKQQNYDTYYKYGLLSLFLIVWVWSLWHPTNQGNWFMENKALFFSVPIIYFLFIWYIKFSKLSLTMVTIFVMLHAMGAHYNYGSVPFGVTIGTIFNSNSNMYDKLVHFSFGLLIVYPLREMFLRIASMKGFWGYLCPFMAVVTLGTFYEIYEWVTVLQYDPQTGYLFIGGSDPFDATKDLLAAIVGAFITLSFVALLGFLKTKKYFKKHMRESFTRDEETFPQEDKHLHKILENVS